MVKDRTDYLIRQILKYYREGSPNRQSAMHQNLMRCVRQLRARGYVNTRDILIPIPDPSTPSPAYSTTGIQ